MNKESPWKKNPMLNFGILVISVGMLAASFSDRAQLLGTIAALIGFAMFYIGYRKAKALGAPPVLRSERRKRLRILIICLVISFVVSPILLWPQISKLQGIGVLVFVIGDVVCLLGFLGFYAWLLKKAGRDETDGA